MWPRGGAGTRVALCSPQTEMWTTYEGVGEISLAASSFSSLISHRTENTELQLRVTVHKILWFSCCWLLNGSPFFLHFLSQMEKTKAKKGLPLLDAEADICPSIFYLICIMLWNLCGNSACVSIFSLFFFFFTSTLIHTQVIHYQQKLWSSWRKDQEGPTVNLTSGDPQVCEPMRRE